MAVAASVAVDMQFSGSAGAWSTLTDVRTDQSITAKYGIPGVGIFDHIAETGTMTFALDNSEKNSGAKLGYYTASGVNARSGFELGIGTRLKIIYSGSTFYKFVGTLDIADPEPGQYGTRLTYCTVLDWMDEAAKHNLKLIPIQTDQTAGQLVATVAANVTRLPVASTLSTGQDLISIAGDNWKDEKTTAYAALSDIAVSDWGYIYIKGDTASGGVLQFDSRNTRINTTTSTASLSDTMVAMSVDRSRQSIVNRFLAQTHPRSTDLPTATCVLYSLGTTIAIAPSATASILGQYTDPLQLSERTGGGSMITPVAGTDYVFTSNPCLPGHDSGDVVDRTTDLVVATSYGGNSVKYLITNNGSQTGYLSLLQARGRGLYDFDPETHTTDDTTSQLAYGLHSEVINMPLQNSQNVAVDVAAYLLSWWKNPKYLINRVEFIGNDTDTLMKAGLQVEPGSRVTLTETVLGITSIAYFVNGVEIEVMPNGGDGIIKFAWSVYPADTIHYFVINTDVLDTGILGW